MDATRSDSPPEPTRPAPGIGPENEAFFKAAAEGRFLVPRCRACGETHWYPRAACPFCFGATALEESRGEGTIYSFSVMRRVPVPYAIAYVTLDEGPTLMTNIVGQPFDAIRVGQRVKVAFREAEGGALVPCFEPA